MEGEINMDYSAVSEGLSALSLLVLRHLLRLDTSDSVTMVAESLGCTDKAVSCHQNAVKLIFHFINNVNNFIAIKLE